MINFIDIKDNNFELNISVMDKAKERVESLAKPPGSLGKLEDIAILLAGITGQIKNTITKKCIIIMSADNGIFEENVSSCPQSVTMAQTINFIKGVTGVGVLAKYNNADLKVYDVGINDDINYPGIIIKKLRKATNNITKGEAMTREEAIVCINIGIEAVGDAVKQGYNLIGNGEMGIGNTSTSSAILIALTGCSIDEAVGRGAGLTPEGYERKKSAIVKAIDINNANSNDALDVLHKLGGFDIACLVGCYFGAAYYRVPICIDGFISAIAALIAYKLNPSTKNFMIASHHSAEPAFMRIMDELELSPIFNLGMRLGEGSGCPMAFYVVELAMAMMNNMATFDEAEINDEYLADIRGMKNE